jgi:hypothetical protein
MQRTTPRVSQILETSLYVEDLDRSRAFYERLFGFAAYFQDERMCAMEVPGEQVLLLFRHGMTDQPAPGPGGLFRRITGAARCIWRSPFHSVSWPCGRHTWRGKMSRWKAGSFGRAAAPACISATPTATRWRLRLRVCGRIVRVPPRPGRQPVPA